MRWILVPLLLLCACSDDATSDGPAPDTSVDAPADTQDGTDAPDTEDTAQPDVPDAAPDVRGDTADSDTRDADPQDLPDTADVADVTDAETDAGEETACPEVEVPDTTWVTDGRYRRLEDFHGNRLDARDITVFLPPGFDPEQRYPVLYMHDGQNLFDARRAAFGVEWGVDESLDALVEAGAVRPWIVVGIDNTAARITEYTPTPDAEFGGGGADVYLDAVVRELKPIIDANFPTLCGRNNTAIAGSSLGGLVSLHAAVRHGDTFGRFGVVSPSLWWNDRALLGRLDDASWQRPVRLWIDAGGQESQRTLTNDLTQNIRAAAAFARGTGMRDGVDLATLEDLDAAHNEASWAARLPAILLFLLGDDHYDEAEPEALSIHAWDPTVPIEGRVALSVEAAFPNGGRITLPPALLPLRSEDPEIVSVDGHVATGHRAGRARVRGMWNGADAELELSVGELLTSELLFMVSVPEGTPQRARIYLTGSIDALGPWSPSGLELEPAGERYRGTLTVPRGTVLEFKVTRGSWETVEKNGDGSERPNRRWLVEGDEEVEVAVARWADR